MAALWCSRFTLPPYSRFTLHEQTWYIADLVYGTTTHKHVLYSCTAARRSWAAVRYLKLAAPDETNHVDATY